MAHVLTLHARTAARRSVTATRIIYTGKESNRLEEVENGTVESWDEVRQTYEDPRRNPFRMFVIPILKLISCSELMRKTGACESHVKSIRNGRRNPSATLRRDLTEIAADYARRVLPEQIDDDFRCVHDVRTSERRKNLMPRVLPSDVVRMIDIYFPWAASTDRRRQAMWNELPTLNGLLGLVDKIPDSMLRLRPEQYADFLWAESSLRAVIRLLERGQVSGAGGVNWPMVQNLNALATLRHLLSQCPDDTIIAKISSLSFLKDPELIQNIQLDFSSAEVSFNSGEWKPATVMAGAALEALLLWAVKRHSEAELASVIAELKLGKLDASHPEDQPWGLWHYISVAQQLKAISADTAQLARLAQDFRNLIHPGRQLRLQMKCDRGTARTTLAAVDRAIRDLEDRFAPSA